MADQETETATKSPVAQESAPVTKGWTLSHELKFYAIVVVGGFSAFFLREFCSVEETANSIIVRPYRWMGFIYIIVSGAAIYQYVKYLRTDDSKLFPLLEKFNLIGVLFLIYPTINFLGSHVTVDQERLTAFDPLHALLSDPTYEFSRIKSVTLNQDDKGKSVLQLSLEGESFLKSIRCSPLVQRALPKLAEVAKQQDIPVEGF